jgi:hypothetical protein
MRSIEFCTILKSSSQETIDSSLDLCKNFLADKYSKTRKIDFLSAINFAKSPTPTDSQEIAHVAALRLYFSLKASLTA